MIKAANIDEAIAFPSVSDKAVLYPFAVLGLQPLANAANRRPVKLWPPGRIGAGTIIGCGAIVYAGVTIGEDCRLGDRALIREGSTIGNRCVIGTNVDIQYQVTIGDDVQVMNGTHITGLTTIGSGTFIGPGVVTANDPHLFRAPVEEAYRDRGQVRMTIGKNVRIGFGAKLLPGITVGDGAIIGAGAIVTKDVPPYATVVGQAAQIRAAASFMTTAELEAAAGAGGIR